MVQCKAPEMENKSTMSKDKVKPLFVLTGMPRGGTTFIYHNLKKHPSIFLPFRKEVNYFNGLRNHYGEDWYADLYEDRAADQVCGDISPPCFFDIISIERIKQYSPDAKIIISVRDPAEYAISLYSQFATYTSQMPPFPDYLDGCFDCIVDDKSLPCKFKDNYIVETIQTFMDEFGENILVVSFAELQKNPLRILQAIEKFVGAPSYFNNRNINADKINASDRKNNIFISKVLRNERLISIVYKILPLKFIHLLRDIFDAWSARKQGDKKHRHIEKYFTEEDLALAENSLRDQCDWVKKLFEESPAVLGTRKSVF